MRKEGEYRVTAKARALRQNMTKAEVFLWMILRKRALNGARFRRQHPIGPYIADFTCPAAKLIVEVAILIVPDFNHSIFRAKSVSKINPGFMMMDLDNPIVQIAAIEQRYPFVFGLCVRRTPHGKYHRGYDG